MASLLFRTSLCYTPVSPGLCFLYAPLLGRSLYSSEGESRGGKMYAQYVLWLTSWSDHRLEARLGRRCWGLATFWHSPSTGQLPEPLHKGSQSRTEQADRGSSLEKLTRNNWLQALKMQLQKKCSWLLEATRCLFVLPKREMGSSRGPQTTVSNKQLKWVLEKVTWVGTHPILHPFGPSDTDFF